MAMARPSGSTPRRSLLPTATRRPGPAFRVAKRNRASGAWWRGTTGPSRWWRVSGGVQEVPRQSRAQLRGAGAFRTLCTPPAAQQPIQRDC
ncbi:hypothetical protein SKAU_G00291540 [Synaphobranchus kaupii]|uniref:Uncharacterized protein n=1 Tax=Synaphobranchus kaupii TaxID=118154 RepID=A0A9Q1ETV3_SYNKA|nr:hypothetical protein SKAU_G00291540 [Synaphobranchus kaupii]